MSDKYEASKVMGNLLVTTEIGALYTTNCSVPRDLIYERVTINLLSFAYF